MYPILIKKLGICGFVGNVSDIDHTLQRWHHRPVKQMGLVLIQFNLDEFNDELTQNLLKAAPGKSVS